MRRRNPFNRAALNRTGSVQHLPSSDRRPRALSIAGAAAAKTAEVNSGGSWPERNPCSSIDRFTWSVPGMAHLVIGLRMRSGLSVTVVVAANLRGPNPGPERRCDPLGSFLGHRADPELELSRPSRKCSGAVEGYDSHCVCPYPPPASPSPTVWAWAPVPRCSHKARDQGATPQPQRAVTPWLRSRRLPAWRRDGR